MAFWNPSYILTYSPCIELKKIKRYIFLKIWLMSNLKDEPKAFLLHWYKIYLK